MKQLFAKHTHAFRVAFSSFIKEPINFLSAVILAMLSTILVVSYGYYKINADYIKYDTISIFIEKEVSKEERKKVRDYFSSEKGIISTSYNSSKDIKKIVSLEYFGEDKTKDSELLEMENLLLDIVEDVFVVSFDSKLVSIEKIKYSINLLNKNKGNMEVSLLEGYGKSNKDIVYFFKNIAILFLFIIISLLLIITRMYLYRWRARILTKIKKGDGIFATALYMEYKIFITLISAGIMCIFISMYFDIFANSSNNSVIYAVENNAKTYILNMISKIDIYSIVTFILISKAIVWAFSLFSVWHFINSVSARKTKAPRKTITNSL